MVCLVRLGWDSSVFWLIGSLVGLAITEWNMNMEYGLG